MSETDCASLGSTLAGSGDPYAPCGESVVPILGGDPVALVQSAQTRAEEIALPQTFEEILRGIQTHKLYEDRIAEVTRDDYLAARAQADIGLVPLAVTQIERVGRAFAASASALVANTGETAVQVAEDSGGVVGAVASGVHRIASGVSSAVGSVGFGVGFASVALVGLGVYLVLRK